MQFNEKGYRISNVGGVRVTAAAQFLYKGYEVSFSQIFNEPSICIFLNDELIAEGVASVEKAIKYIDRVKG